MKPFTLDNNVIFMYGGKPFDWSLRSDDNPLVCHYAKATREPQNFREECVTTMLLVKEQAKEIGRPLQLFLSGGLDSEVVAKAMIEAEVEINPVTFRFKHGLNSHEIHYVEKFAKRHGLDVEYVDLDIEEWIFSDEALEMAITSECQTLAMLPHMMLMDRSWSQGFSPVLGNGDLYIAKKTSMDWRMTGRGEPFTWEYIEYEGILAWYRFAIKRGILGAIAFFQHTPEITLSMMQEPVIQKCIRGELPFKMSTRSSKYEVYFKHWPDLEPRIKFNGGEKVSSLYAKALPRFIASARPDYNRDWVIPANEFQRIISQ